MCEIRWQRVGMSKQAQAEWLVSAVLEEAGKFASGVLAPNREAGDRVGSVMVDGQVKLAPGYDEAFKQMGDALYYAKYFADKTYNPFVPYPILAMYFIMLTLILISIFGLINKRLNRHLPQNQRQKIKLRPRLIR